MARRTLIIGLGSNGYEICDLLTRRIQWEYGGLDKTPWLEVLCLETAEVTRAGVLGQNSYHIKIDETDFRALRENRDGTYDKSLDLGRWIDQRIMDIPGLAQGVTNGASNIRMIGRLAFLFSKNLERIDSEIRNRLNALTTLTEAQAKAQRGPLPDGSDPSLDLSDQIWVYVVGTLAGGTCSGAFIDLGYFLHERFKDIGAYNIKRVGIFSLPHPGYDPQKWRRRRANVFAALTELNHFSTRGKTYTAQFPGETHRTEIKSTLPYDHTYLVQPTGATDGDYQRLKVEVAQYLHTDVFVEQAGELEAGKLSERDAAQVDVSADIDEDDLKESPQKFYTFGMSAIEFPAYLVAQACCYKLCHEAFTQWLEPRDLSPVDLETARRKTLGITPETAAAKLLEDAPPTFEKRMQDAISNVLNGKISLAELQQAEDMIERSMNANAPGTTGAESALPPGSVAGHVRVKRLAPVQNEYKANVSLHIQQHLSSMKSGPDYCQRLLEALAQWLTGRIEQLESAQAQSNRNSSVEGAHANMETARERLGGCVNDWVLGVMGMGVGKSMALKKYGAEYEVAAHEYIARRLSGLVEPAEAQIWKELLAWIQQLQIRVSAPDNGLLAQSAALRDLLATKFRELDETTPTGNGKVLFQPGSSIDGKYAAGTVGQTYQSVWSHKSAEEYQKAKSELVAAWSSLPQIDADSGQIKDAETYFQAPLAPVTPMQQKASLERAVAQISPRARRHFREVFAGSVFDRITPDDSELVRDVLNKSRVMLDLGKHLNDRYENTGTKNIGLVFFEGRDSIGGDVETKAKTFWRTVGEVKSGADVLRPVSARDRQSILFLREEAAFSLPIVRGLREGEAGFAGDFEEQSQKSTIHARRDVPKWEPLFGSLDPDSARRKALCLLGMALSKDKTNAHILRRVAQPTPAATYVYDLVPPLPPSTHQLNFPDDLKDCAQLLRSLPEVERRLSEDVRQVRDQGAPATMVGEILQFTSGIARLDIKENEAIIDEKRAFDLITQFWKQDAEMMNAFEAGYRPDESILNRMWHDAQSGFPLDGYYCECPNHQFLGAEKQSIPARCPREGCSRYLRWAGLDADV